MIHRLENGHRAHGVSAVEKISRDLCINLATRQCRDIRWPTRIERSACICLPQESIIYSYDLATVPSILPAFANSRDLIVVDEVRRCS